MSFERQTTDPNTHNNEVEAHTRSEGLFFVVVWHTVRIHEIETKSMYVFMPAYEPKSKYDKTENSFDDEHFGASSSLGGRFVVAVLLCRE